jgi:formate-dependent phosphoribosylglycinamide formyltransferase (GAR transformylase)
MNRQKLNVETLCVDSFETAPAAQAPDAAPTRNCDTRQTACTIGPDREG